VVGYQTALRGSKQRPRLFVGVVQLEGHTRDFAFPQLQAACLVHEVVLARGVRELVHKLVECHLEVQVAVVQAVHRLWAAQFVVRSDYFWVLVEQLVRLLPEDERQGQGAKLPFKLRILRGEVLANIAHLFGNEHGMTEVRRFEAVPTD